VCAREYLAVVGCIPSVTRSRLASNGTTALRILTKPVLGVRLETTTPTDCANPDGVQLTIPSNSPSITKLAVNIKPPIAINERGRASGPKGGGCAGGGGGGGGLAGNGGMIGEGEGGGGGGEGGGGGGRSWACGKLGGDWIILGTSVDAVVVGSCGGGGDGGDDGGGDGGGVGGGGGGGGEGGGGGDDRGDDGGGDDGGDGGGGDGGGGVDGDGGVLGGGL